ncbi:MAG: thioesterase family protein [Acidobacteriota bacterium]|nr:thioesterase family protein [Acidobacteriota bacterium]
MTYFQIRKKVHWSDCDAAGVVWFAKFLGWYEDAEEELYAAVLGQSRQSLLDTIGFGMPRVEVSAKYRAPTRAGHTVRVGLHSTLEHARRLRHAFEIRDDTSGTLLAEGFVRVACVDLKTFEPRDLPAEVHALVERLPEAAARQARGEVEIPWT